MGDGLNSSLGELLTAARQYLAQPWFFYQLLLIAVLAVTSRLIGRQLEGRLERWARGIRGHPGVLRMIVALMRRTSWLVLAAFLLVALAIMREVTWPSRSYLIYIALTLVLAWVVAAVAARIVRNRVVARLIAILAWSYAATLILGVDDAVASFLDALALQVGEYRISLLIVAKTLVMLSVTLWLAVMAGNFIEERVRLSEELAPSIKVLIGKVARIGLVVLAGFWVLSAIGIDLTALTVFSGAIGVGVGFGLQKVVSNFTSGIIILLDKSIKPGDTISLGDTFGWIRELRARFVSVITRDGREYLIPNEDFVTNRVINWSYSDELVRLDVHFGVSYDSDPHQVSALAIEAAMTVGRVDADRRPVCWLTEFGGSSLNFVLRFWIRDPQQGLTNIRGKVLLALWDSFKANGIEIPYPHRELVLKQPVEVAMPE